MLRKPCVAGRFYPDDSEALKSMVDGFMGPMNPSAERERAVSVIAPHAGYMYSGAVAGAVYSSAVIPDDIILIGPNHTGIGERASVMADGVWEFPLGKAEVNGELSGLLLDSCGLFSRDYTAHLMEHSLEVQLPFIYLANKKARIVPVTVMHADIDECEEMGRALAKAVKAYGKETLIAVSSDMNHYESEKKTRDKDNLAIERVLKLDSRGLLDVTSSRNITMCGAVPAAIAIVAARSLGARAARLVAYSTSGEKSGDFSHVVGYAGIIIK